MPIEEPADALWSHVKQMGGRWPQANEDMVAGVADGWRTAGGHFARAAETDHQPLETAWPDPAGSAFTTRVHGTRAAAGSLVPMAEGLAARSAAYAGEVAATKNDIRSMIEGNLARYEQVRAMQPRVAEDVVTPFVAKLAGMVNERMAAAENAFGPGAAIPDPPPRPPADPGAGEWGSRTPGVGNTLFEGLAAAGALGAAASDKFPHGGEFLAHYLSNLGGTKVVSSEQVVGDVPALRTAIEQQIDVEVAELTRLREYGKPIPFATDWREFNITPALDGDWHLAIGNVQHSATGVATVLPPTEPGGQPTVSIDYEVHLYDRYNFDHEEGKAATVLGIPLRDTDFLQLHLTGLAREFDVVGEPGGVQHREWEWVEDR